jgi:hypothetical protein
MMKVSMSSPKAKRARRNSLKSCTVSAGFSEDAERLYSLL